MEAAIRQFAAAVLYQRGERPVPQRDSRGRCFPDQMRRNFSRKSISFNAQV